MPGVGSGPGPGLCRSFAHHGITSFPSLSRGDQCFTNNLTYLEVTAGNAALVKHGKENGWGSHPAHAFTGIETHKTSVLHYLMHFIPESLCLFEASLGSKELPKPGGTQGVPAPGAPQGSQPHHPATLNPQSARSKPAPIPAGEHHPVCEVIS